ncbi:MAG: glutamine synthetase family protein [Alphaproteobacteria bacterium]
MADGSLPEEVHAFLQKHPETRYIDTVVFDICGGALGKRYPIADLEKIYNGGFKATKSLFVLDVTGNCSDPMGYGFSDGDPDGYGVPIPGTLVPMPWSPVPVAQVQIDMRDPVDDQPLWFDPRVVLQKVVDRFTADGLRPICATELEFFLIDPQRTEDKGPKPPITPRSGIPQTATKVYGMEKLEDFAEILIEMEQTCLAQNVPTSVASSEYAPGQFELNLRHVENPVVAGDHACLMRRCIKSVARRHGLDATFLAKPYPDSAGSGLHVHSSFLNDDSRNIFDEELDPDETVMRHAMAGLQATMAESMAFLAPSLNSYRRFAANNFTPVTKDWGYDNRSLAFRIPSDTGAGRRIEHRIAGADANPHLVLACILAGIHYGITNKLEPETGPRHGNAGEKMADDIPFKLWDALNQLDHAPVLRDYFGDDYVSIYKAVKDNEFDALMAVPLRREFEWYL